MKVIMCIVKFEVDVIINFSRPVSFKTSSSFKCHRYDFGIGGYNYRQQIKIIARDSLVVADIGRDMS